MFLNLFAMSHFSTKCGLIVHIFFKAAELQMSRSFLLLYTAAACIFKCFTGSNSGYFSVFFMLLWSYSLFVWTSALLAVTNRMLLPHSSHYCPSLSLCHYLESAMTALHSRLLWSHTFHKLVFKLLFTVHRLICYKIMVS